MKKTALKLAGAALAVPILLGGLALPANAADMSVAQPPPPPPVSLKPKPLPPAIDGVYTPARRAQIAKDVAALRAKNAFLGATTGPVQYNLYGGGAVQPYKGGQIIWGKTGAFILKGAVKDTFYRLGGFGGWLGYPRSNETGGLKNGGTVQRFNTGDVYWSSKSGAHHVFVDYTWKKNGGLNGKLGYPTSDFTKIDKTKVNGNGWYQKFQGGTIYQDTKGAERVVFNKK
jgi:uncharacterized protein with LGFP repeats